MTKIVCVAGTRPEAIKMAPVIEALQKMSGVEMRFIWSGQHYDYEMSSLFLEELSLPEPDVNLDVRSGDHAEQVTKVMLGLNKVFKDQKPDAVLAEGDTNTVLAAGLTAVKDHIPFGHVEAGLRSYDRAMPEEINRCAAAVCAQLNFAPTPNAAINLLYEGVPPCRVFITGNTIVDVVRKVMKNIGSGDVIKELGLRSSSKMILVTLHRAENVDSKQRLGEIVRSLVSLDNDVEIVFPVHPRTSKRLIDFGLLNELRSCRNVTLTKPLGYAAFLNLVGLAKAVLTDSGGVQEEAMVLHVPTITLRYNTERPETIWYGENVLTRLDMNSITDCVQRVLLNNRGTEIRPDVHGRAMLSGRWKRVEDSMFRKCPLGDGKSGKRIAEIVVDKRVTLEPSDVAMVAQVHFIRRIAKHVKVSDINAYGKAVVTLAYDPSGEPLFPYPELRLEPGCLVRLFGSPSSEKTLDLALGKLAPGTRAP